MSTDEPPEHDRGFAAPQLLKEAGLGLEHVVKTTVFVVQADDFETMNNVYREFFRPPYPCRSTVGVVLPNPALLVEIEAIALRGSLPERAP
jgi:2-iminobutanoate/2-iminopropanoate deaminase